MNALLLLKTSNHDFRFDYKIMAIVYIHYIDITIRYGESKDYLVITLLLIYWLPISDQSEHTWLNTVDL